MSLILVSFDITNLFPSVPVNECLTLKLDNALEESLHTLR